MKLTKFAWIVQQNMEENFSNLQSMHGGEALISLYDALENKFFKRFELEVDE